MSQATEALTNLTAALKDAIAIIKEKLLEQASTDARKLEGANAQLVQVQAQLDAALTQLAGTTTADGDVAVAIAAATADLTAQLKDLVTEAQSATPA